MAKVQSKIQRSASKGNEPNRPQAKQPVVTSERPEFNPVHGVSLAEVHDALQKIVSSPYCGDVSELAMAAVLNAARTGDAPLWLWIVGEPSAGKTETVWGVSGEPIIYSLDSLTDKAFISGFVSPDGSPPTDLLGELNGRCLLVKDLTPLLCGREEITRGVLGQMVSIYDGTFSRKTGTRERVEYKARFSFLGCVTGKGIERHQRYIQEMGSRLLFCRVPSLTKEEEEEGMSRLLENGKRTGKIEDYKKLCSSYVDDLLKSGPLEIELTATQEDELKCMARLLARGRAVSIQDDDESARSGNVRQVEGPFRILSQLRSLVIALALVHKRERATVHEMEIVRRVVLSTIPLNRASVLILFQRLGNLTPGNGLTIALCKKAGMNEHTAQKRLKELVELGILSVDTSQKEHEYRPLPEFLDILTKPIEPLDHRTNEAVTPSRIELPHGVNLLSRMEINESEANSLEGTENEITTPQGGVAYEEVEDA